MVTPEEVEKRVAKFLNLCRRHGVRVTHQRTEILRDLVGTEEHPDAETLYARVRRRIPSMSLDTIYRTLRMFEEQGFITRVGSERDRARFDANTNRHHHFVCGECAFIGDIYSDGLDRVTTPPEVAEMGSAQSIHVELRGVCNECQRKAEKKRRGDGGGQGCPSAHVGKAG